MTSFSVLCYFLKEINIFSVFLLRYKNTRESLRELKKTAFRVHAAFLALPNFHSRFYNLIETRYKVCRKEMKDRVKYTSILPASSEACVPGVILISTWKKKYWNMNYLCTSQDPQEDLYYVQYIFFYSG